MLEKINELGVTPLAATALGATIVALVAVALAAWAVAGRRARRREIDRLEGEVRRVSRQLRRVEGDQLFITRFLREFPDLSRRLGAEKRYREVPVALTRILARIFEPQQALILLRSDGDEGGNLVVAAAFPEGSAVQPGTKVPLAYGELGFVARTQRVMDAGDIGKERSRFADLEIPSLPGFSTHLAAPLVSDADTLGVVALQGIYEQRGQAKEVLRLVAHVGSLTLKSVSAFLRMKSAADVDPLTGIFNKRVLLFKLGELLFESEQRGVGLSVFIFDIDNFKNYNDRNGHVAGDDLLRTLTRIIADQVRKDDIFGRFGGEEFLLILPGRSEVQALMVAEKVRQIIERYDFPHREGQPLKAVTVSGGTATFPSDATTSVALLNAADTALYRAKLSGRNRVLAFSKLAPGEQQGKSVPDLNATD